MTPLTIREEANVITAFAFRNGFLETLHSGEQTPLLDDPANSRITDAEMKKLMIEASEHVAKLLTLKEQDPHEYRRFLRVYGRMYTRSWVTTPVTCPSTKGFV